MSCHTRLACLALLTITLGFFTGFLHSPEPARAQTVIPTTSTAPTIIPGGVYLDPDGMIHHRAAAPQDIAILRARANAALHQSAQPTPGKLGYISLPRALAAANAARENHQPISEDLRNLGGLTQLQYIFLFPDDHDLVIAGPMEPLAPNSASPLEPVGAVSGRPALQLDDFIAAWRATARLRGGSFIGCSIDPVGNALAKAKPVFDANPRASDADLARLVAAAVGPQQVSVFGVPRDTRLALVLVSADLKMKRFSMGLESSPIAQFPSAVGNSRTAVNRFWFDSMYDPLLVSAAGDSYALRGQRLGLKCGAASFDERGATDEAKAFTAAFTKNIPALAATIPVFADLQNVSDLTLLASLIRRDTLDRKIGWDLASAASAYDLPATPAPKTVETQAGMTAGSIVAGGVAFHFAATLAPDNRVAEAADPPAAPSSVPASTLTSLRQRPKDSWFSAPTK